MKYIFTIFWCIIFAPIVALSQKKLEHQVYLVEAKLVMMVDSSTLASKSLSVGVALTNLTDSAIYIPYEFLRDISGAYFTVVGTKAKESQPESLTKAAMVENSKKNQFGHGGGGFGNRYSNDLQKRLDEKSKYSFDIADSLVSKGTIARDDVLYTKLRLATFIQPKSTILLNVLQPDLLFNNLGVGKVTATITPLSTTSSNVYPLRIGNYRKVTSQDILYIPLDWYSF